ncbi:hypothetical protein JXL83_06080 [candidate division WOR-3 bacterium]|nr:hypothetical protein [candidate division WOR-3 bacterium]
MKSVGTLTAKYPFLEPVAWYFENEQEKFLTRKLPLNEKASRLKVREENIDVTSKNSITKNPDLVLFLKNSVLPLLSPDDPLRKMLEKEKTPSGGCSRLFDMEDITPELKNLVSPSVKTFGFFPERSHWLKNNFREYYTLSEYPDLAVFFDVSCTKNKMGAVQTLMLKKNEYSIEKIIVKDRIDIKKLSRLKEDPSLALKTLQSVLRCVEKIKLPYNLRRLPAHYHPLLEKISDSMGFPPLASLKLKSEILTGTYIISWTR